MQAAVGPVEWLIFMWPANIIVLGILIALLAVFYALRSKVYLFRFMTQAEAAVPALATASVLTVIMGLTRQVSENHPAMDPIGLSKMLSFWPFILTYLWNIVIIAEVFIHQAIHFKKRYIPSLVCHLGLFVFVTCGVLGSADMQRLKMYCEEGTPEWRAIDDYKYGEGAAVRYRAAEVCYRGESCKIHIRCQYIHRRRHSLTGSY